MIDLETINWKGFDIHPRENKINMSTDNFTDLHVGVTEVPQVMGPTLKSVQDFLKSVCVGGNVFDGKMYFSWRRKLDVGLRLVGLYENVQSGKLDINQDKFLADCLVGCMSDTILSGFRGCDQSGMAMLNRLEAEYNRKDSSSKFAVLIQLLSYKYKGKGIGKHCDDVVGLLNELTGMGMPLDQELCVLILLYSLPDSTLASVICGQDTRSLNVDQVRIRAVSEEERLRRTESGQVLFSSNKHLGNQGSPPAKRVGSRVSSGRKCYGCGKEDYVVKNCPRKAKRKELVSFLERADKDESLRMPALV